MTPGADAVGLIDRHPHQLPLLMNILQQLTGGLHLQALRRQIDQPQSIAAHPSDQVTAPRRIEAAVQASRRNPAPLQVLHLIFHQRDQRRDHQCRAGSHQRRHLIAQRFAATGRHDDKGVVAFQYRIYDSFLEPLEVIESEKLLQRIFRR